MGPRPTSRTFTTFFHLPLLATYICGFLLSLSNVLLSMMCFSLHNLPSLASSTPPPLFLPSCFSCCLMLCYFLVYLWPDLTPVVSQRCLCIDVSLYLSSLFVYFVDSSSSLSEPPAKKLKRQVSVDSSEDGTTQETNKCVYTAELIVFDKHKNCLLTNGEYELLLHSYWMEDSDEPAPQKGKTWENGFRNKVDLKLSSLFSIT